MDGWAAVELSELELGDKRLKQRAVKVLDALSAAPTSSIPAACGSWSSSKAAYRFFDNDRVKASAVREAHAVRTVQRMEGRSRVLLVQDTTGLDYTRHRGTRGLGALDNHWIVGLKQHTVLAVGTDGTPLGVVHQEIWARDDAEAGVKRRHKALPIQAKESYRWVRSLEQSRSRVPPAVVTITVADREADIYEVFAAARPGRSELLIRAAQDRRVATEQRYLWDSVSAVEPCGTMTVSIARSGDRPARTATLRIRFRSVELLPPSRPAGSGPLPPVWVTAILAEEVAPPAGGEAVCWLLLTTLAVEDAAAAEQCVRWYSCRWLVERYHYVLKSGCQVEELQLESAERLERALALYSMVAWRLLWLTYESRLRPDESCEVALSRAEWQSLYATTHKTAQVPETPMPLRQAVRWIAQLGGFLGRKSDREPGVKTLWRGWMRLIDITATWSILRPDVGNG